MADTAGATFFACGTSILGKQKKAVNTAQAKKGKPLL
jgi:hypothetical protein